MSLLVVGMSHRSAPLPVLERCAVPATDTHKVLGSLLDCDNVDEVLLLSTCNRVEVYAVVQTFHGGLGEITEVLAQYSGLPLEEFADHLYVHYAAACVEHLFAVASGLDSMVVGEPQILGQVRTAYAGAEQVGSVGRTLHELAQHALRVGKRVHTETDIDAEGASVVSEALADAAAALTEGRPGASGAGLVGRRALVVGAGSLGGLAAAQLRRAGAGEIVLANRTLSSAERIAALCRAEGTPAYAVPLSELSTALAGVDLVVCCVGAGSAVLRAEHVRQAWAGRDRQRGRLVVCDLGLPRDVEPAVGDLPGVTLVDLTTLQRRLGEPASADGATSALRADKHVEKNGQKYKDTTAADRARRMVAEEVRAYLVAQRTAEVTPTVTALRKRAAEVVDAELLRLDSRLPGLDPAVRDELARTVRRVVDKLLHAPTVRVKELARTGGGEAYADALRELFGLDPQTAAAVSATFRAASGEPAAEDRRPR